MTKKYFLTHTPDEYREGSVVSLPQPEKKIKILKKTLDSLTTTTNGHKVACYKIYYEELR